MTGKSRGVLFAAFLGFAGLVGSTAAFAYSDVTLDTMALTTIGSWGSTAISVKPEKKLLYLAAADDAAQFVALNLSEPTALLREAMDVERGFLRELHVSEADHLSDHDLAVLVIDRAAIFTAGSTEKVD